MVQELMGWHENKATLWYMTPNPMFGYISAECMVKIGQHKKVIKAIRIAKMENFQK